VLTLWPYQSLPRKGFVWFIGATAMLVTLPLLAVLGSPALWFLLCFFVLALTAMYFALQRNYSDTEIREELVLTRELATLTRKGPRGKHQEWQANPHWLRVELHATSGPVLNYITLRGGPREVEIGAFLSEEERLELVVELRKAIAALR
jgi:uncharacterized membrane protein